MIFRQNRWKLLGAGLIGIILVGIGASFIVNPHFFQTPRQSAASVALVGWLITPFFSLCVVGVGVSLARPITVKIGQAGIVIRYHWRTYTRPWSALSGFKLWKYKMNRTVVFNDTTLSNGRLAEVNRKLTGATSAMPTALDVAPEQLLALIEEARERWGANAYDARGNE